MLGTPWRSSRVTIITLHLQVSTNANLSLVTTTVFNTINYSTVCFTVLHTVLYCIFPFYLAFEQTFSQLCSWAFRAPAEQVSLILVPAQTLGRVSRNLKPAMSFKKQLCTAQPTQQGYTNHSSSCMRELTCHRTPSTEYCTVMYLPYAPGISIIYLVLAFAAPSIPNPEPYPSGTGA